MPRPAEGYRNKAGQQVPGVHDITNAYMPKPALVGWAYNRGKQGLPLYEKGVLEIGTTVHAMAEANLKGDSDREIEAKLKELRDPINITARSAYGAFCEWREAYHVRSLAHEVTIVSEAYQLGGMPDCIAEISGDIGLLEDLHRGAQGALRRAAAGDGSPRATLWNELHPKQRVASCHLIYLPKDGSTPKHHAYADYAPAWREFAHLLAAFAEKHGTPKGADARDADIAKLPADIGAASTAAPKSRGPRKRYVRLSRRPSPAQLATANRLAAAAERTDDDGRAAAGLRTHSEVTHADRGLRNPSAQRCRRRPALRNLARQTQRRHPGAALRSRGQGARVQRARHQIDHKDRPGRLAGPGGGRCRDVRCEPLAPLAHPGEAEYVSRTIAALIIKGEIGASKIAKTTARLRQIWRESNPGEERDQ
jgi:hypothetical protein